MFVLTVLGVLFYGPKKAIEAAEWYLYRVRDRKVRDYLEECLSPGTMTSNGIKKWPIGKSISEIHEATGIRKRWLPGSLERLRRLQEVFHDEEGWKFKL